MQCTVAEFTLHPPLPGSPLILQVLKHATGQCGHSPSTCLPPLCGASTVWGCRQVAQGAWVRARRRCPAVRQVMCHSVCTCSGRMAQVPVTILWTAVQFWESEGAGQAPGSRVLPKGWVSGPCPPRGLWISRAGGSGAGASGGQQASEGGDPSEVGTLGARVTEDGSNEQSGGQCGLADTCQPRKQLQNMPKTDPAQVTCVRKQPGRQAVPAPRLWFPVGVHLGTQVLLAQVGCGVFRAE